MPGGCGGSLGKAWQRRGRGGGEGGLKLGHKARAVTHSSQKGIWEQGTFAFIMHEKVEPDRYDVPV